MVTSLYIVIALLVAKPDKVAELKHELMIVRDLSSQESTCRDYRVHQDLNNPAQFVLYEAWESKEAHALQFTKPYILELGGKLGDLLAQPYQVMFVNEI
jgi:quinol monooxygenase YgiN